MAESYGGCTNPVAAFGQRPLPFVGILVSSESLRTVELSLAVVAGEDSRLPSFLGDF